MNIVFVSDTFLPSKNGIVTSIINSSRKLAEKGHKVLIIAAKPEKKVPVFIHRNVKIHYSLARNFSSYPDYKVILPNPLLLSKISKFKPDIIHTHVPSFIGWEALLIAKVGNIPFVSTYHTLLPDYAEHLKLPKKVSKSKIVNWMIWDYTRIFYNSTDAVISPSPGIKKLLRKEKIKKRILVISNGVDLDKFKRGKKSKKFRILHVGRISLEKSIDVVIKAFKGLSVDAELVIVGDGPDLDKMKKLARSDKRIKFTGSVSHEKVPKYFSSADLFVTASKTETEGIVLLEAMACGLPVVGVDSLAVPRLVKNGWNGFVVEPDNSKKFGQAILNVMTSKERGYMSKNSRMLAEKYSLKKSVETLEKLYRHLIKSNKSIIRRFKEALNLTSP